jgi:hypothetical protein
MFIETVCSREPLPDPVICEPDVDLLPVESGFLHKEFLFDRRRVWVRLMHREPFQQNLSLRIREQSSLEVSALANLPGRQILGSPRDRGYLPARRIEDDSGGSERRPYVREMAV